MLGLWSLHHHCKFSIQINELVIQLFTQFWHLEFIQNTYHELDQNSIRWRNLSSVGSNWVMLRWRCSTSSLSWLPFSRSLRLWWVKRAIQKSSQPSDGMMLSIINAINHAITRIKKGLKRRQNEQSSKCFISLIVHYSIVKFCTNTKQSCAYRSPKIVQFAMHCSEDINI